MRVLLLSRSLTAGGAERQAVTLAQGLRARGHDCAIATFYGEAESCDGIRVIPLRKRGRWDVLRFLGRLRRLLRRERPDVLYTFLPVANLLGLALRPLAAPAGLVLGVRSSNMDARRYDRLSRLTYALEARLARFADAVIVNAHAGRRAAIDRGIPERRIAVVRNGLDPQAFSRDGEAGRQFRRALAFADEDIVVGVVARFDPMKDHATFLHAFRAAAARVPRLKAVLVGAGPEPVGAAAAALGDKVRLTGWRSDMPAVYSGLDVLCLPSAFGEGTPNVVAEAMACELPCAVTDVGDSASLVGPCGRVAPPHDPAALSRCLVELAELPAEERRAIGRQARARIASLLSVERLARETEAVLAAVLARRGSAPTAAPPSAASGGRQRSE